mmetsp:Transcript_7514/g.8540  ORF Transcript_7514/g.8540 Transcript_7514/m.8540 type:complete len:281 (+) Transcript_7514:24-866(+)
MIFGSASGAATEAQFWKLWSGGDYRGLYEFGLEVGDPRVENWLFMKTPVPTICLALAYVLVVVLGKQFMKTREAFNVKPLVILYNVTMVGLAWYTATEIYEVSSASGMNLTCNPVDYSTDPLPLRLASVLWWYYFSKCIEFLDTIFMVVKKKNKQISFLHVYHHTSMFLIWWMGIKWVAGGNSYLGAMINSWVHVIMYFYYLVRALGFRVPGWVKMFVTALQFVQFVSVIYFAVGSVMTDCDFPMWMHLAFIAYVCSMVVLFGNFALHAYCTKKSKKKKI